MNECDIANHSRQMKHNKCESRTMRIGSTHIVVFLKL